MTTLKIPRGLMDDLDGQALNAYPEECCGALLGRWRSGEGGEIAEVGTIWPAENVHAGPRSKHFAIDPGELLQIHKLARSEGYEVLGYYHSHPDSGAAPSLTDLAGAGSGVSYLIVAVNEREVLERRSWRLRSDHSGFEEEQLQ